MNLKFCKQRACGTCPSICIFKLGKNVFFTKIQKCFTEIYLSAAKYCRLQWRRRYICLVLSWQCFEMVGWLAWVASLLFLFKLVLFGAPKLGTSYNQYSVRQRVLLVTLRSNIVAWRYSSTPSYTGSMFQIQWHTSSVCWYTGVCKARLQNTSSTAARLSPMLSAGNVYGLPVVCSSSYHDTVSPHSAVGPSLLWVPRSGTRCQTTSELNRTVPVSVGI